MYVFDVICWPQALVACTLMMFPPDMIITGVFHNPLSVPSSSLSVYYFQIYTTRKEIANGKLSYSLLTLLLNLMLELKTYSPKPGLISR